MSYRFVRLPETLATPTPTSTSTSTSTQAQAQTQTRTQTQTQAQARPHQRLEDTTLLCRAYVTKHEWEFEATVERLKKMRECSVRRDGKGVQRRTGTGNPEPNQVAAAAPSHSSEGAKGSQMSVFGSFEAEAEAEAGSNPAAEHQEGESRQEMEERENAWTDLEEDLRLASEATVSDPILGLRQALLRNLKHTEGDSEFSRTYCTIIEGNGTGNDNRRKLYIFRFVNTTLIDSYRDSSLTDRYTSWLSSLLPDGHFGRLSLVKLGTTCLSKLRTLLDPSTTPTIPAPNPVVPPLTSLESLFVKEDNLIYSEMWSAFTEALVDAYAWKEGWTLERLARKSDALQKPLLSPTDETTLTLQIPEEMITSSLSMRQPSRGKPVRLWPNPQEGVFIKDMDGLEHSDSLVMERGFCVALGGIPFQLGQGTTWSLCWTPVGDKGTLIVWPSHLLRSLEETAISTGPILDSAFPVPSTDADPKSLLASITKFTSHSPMDTTDKDKNDPPSTSSSLPPSPALTPLPDSPYINDLAEIEDDLPSVSVLPSRDENTTDPITHDSVDAVSSKLMSPNRDKADSAIGGDDWDSAVGEVGNMITDDDFNFFDAPHAKLEAIQEQEAMEALWGDVGMCTDLGLGLSSAMKRDESQNREKHRRMSYVNERTTMEQGSPLPPYIAEEEKEEETPVAESLMDNVDVDVDVDVDFDVDEEEAHDDLFEDTPSSTRFSLPPTDEPVSISQPPSPQTPARQLETPIPVYQMVPPPHTTRIIPLSMRAIALPHRIHAHDVSVGSIKRDLDVINKLGDGKVKDRKLQKKSLIRLAAFLKRQAKLLREQKDEEERMAMMQANMAMDLEEEEAMLEKSVNKPCSRVVTTSDLCTHLPSGLLADLTSLIASKLPISALIDPTQMTSCLGVTVRWNDKARQDNVMGQPIESVAAAMETSATVDELFWSSSSLNLCCHTRSSRQSNTHATPTTVYAGHSGLIMELSITAIPYWQSLGLKPLSGKKNISSSVLFTSEQIGDSHVKDWHQHLAEVYESCGFGKMEISGSNCDIIFVIGKVDPEAIKSAKNAASSVNTQFIVHPVAISAIRDWRNVHSLTLCIYDRIHHPILPPRSRFLDATAASAKVSQRLLPAPAFTIASKPLHPTRSWVSSFHFLSPNEIRFCHVAYTVIRNTLICFIIDGNGEGWVFDKWDCSPKDLKSALTKLFWLIVGFVRSAQLDWRVVIARYGLMKGEEVEDWFNVLGDHKKAMADFPMDLSLFMTTAGSPPTPSSSSSSSPSSSALQKTTQILSSSSTTFPLSFNHDLQLHRLPIRLFDSVIILPSYTFLPSSPSSNISYHLLLSASYSLPTYSTAKSKPDSDTEADIAIRQSLSELAESFECLRVLGEHRYMFATEPGNKSEGADGLLPCHLEAVKRMAEGMCVS